MMVMQHRPGGGGGLGAPVSGSNSLRAATAGRTAGAAPAPHSRPPPHRAPRRQRVQRVHRVRGKAARGRGLALRRTRLLTCTVQRAAQCEQLALRGLVRGLRA